MKKRILALSLASALVVGAMASCGTEKTPVSSVEARDVALTLWGSEADQDFLKEMSADFAKTYAAEHDDVSSVEVTVKIVGEDQSATEALKDINAAADVFGVPGDQTAQLADAKAIYAMPEDVVKSIVDLVGQNTADKTFYDGSYYGFPYSPNTAQALFYNKTLYTEDDVKNLNTMLEKDLGADVKNFGHQTGAFDSSTWYFTVGAELFTNSDKSVCTFDNAECVEALKFVQDNAAKMYLGANSDAVALIKDGKLAAFCDGSWNAQMYKDAFGENLGVTMLPKVTINEKEYQMTCFGGVKYYAVNAASKEPEVAIALAEYLASADVQLKKYEALGSIPTALALLENETIKADPVTSAYMAQGEYIVVQQPCIPGDWWGDAEALFKDISSGTIKADDIQAKLTEHVASWKAME